jgi:anti-sigma B factor antagonist
MIDKTTTRGRLFSRRMAGHTVLSVAGDLDIATTAALRIEIAKVLSATTAPVIIDLSGVSFCDASGLALLVGTQRRARLDGRTVVLAGPRPNVLKLLHITGLDRAFSVHPTLAAAQLGAGHHSAVA